jgi:hypothetical protein
MMCREIRLCVPDFSGSESRLWAARIKKMTDHNAEQCKCAGGKMKDGRCVMPKVTFSAFIMSLNTSALFYLGEIPDPATGRKHVDLMLAQNTIDTLMMLEEKTAGNLSAEDANMISKFTQDLQVRFVKVS